MAHGVQTDELYDFLYRDSSRFISLSAQIFSGHITGVEQSDLSKKTEEKSSDIKVGVPSVAGVSGASKNTEEIQTGFKKNIDLHDVNVTDVLATLREHKKINDDVQGARHGELILVNGTVTFIDRSMMELGAHVIEAIATSGLPQAQGMQAVLTMLTTLMKKIQLPSAFILQPSHGKLVVGTIKDAGMEEPISAYYFKHGKNGLGNVFLVGIKESPSGMSLPQTTLIGGAGEAAKGLQEMLFPPDSIKVTPLAIFRKL